MEDSLSRSSTDEEVEEPGEAEMKDMSDRCEPQADEPHGTGLRPGSAGFC